MKKVALVMLLASLVAFGSVYAAPVRKPVKKQTKTEMSMGKKKMVAHKKSWNSHAKKSSMTRGKMAMKSTKKHEWKSKTSMKKHVAMKHTMTSKHVMKKKAMKKK